MKCYEKPVIEISKFQYENIMTASNETPFSSSITVKQSGTSTTTIDF